MAVSDSVPVAKKTLGILTASGEVLRVAFEDDVAESAMRVVDWNRSHSTIIVGYIKYVRGRFLTLHEIEIQNGFHPEEMPMQVTVHSSLDGKNVDRSTVPHLAYQSGNYSHYTTRVSANNLAIQISGQFNLSSLDLKFSNHGKR